MMKKEGKMTSNLIQKIAKIIFSLKYNFKLTQVKLPEKLGSSHKQSSGYITDITRNAQNGVTNAAYGNRFAIIPFKCFAAILYEKKIEDIDELVLSDLSKENKLVINREERNIDEFVHEFIDWRTRFIESFEKQNSDSNEALEILREEIFHNKHLSNTSTWSVSQALTVLYRLATTYLIHYRYKLNNEIQEKKHHLEITQLLLNIYFVRQEIARYTTPIAESYCHYKDTDLTKVGKIYGKKTEELCYDFLTLNNFLKINFPTETENIMDFISKIILNYPYAYQLTHCTGLDYVKFQHYFSMIPIERLKKVKDLVIQNKFSTSKELMSYIEGILNKPSKLETTFASSILYYATSILVPKQLILFILKQLAFTNYRKVLIHYLKDIFSGGEKLNNPYSNIPAIRSFGEEDQFFNIDLAMDLFKDKEAFFIAQNSLEPTLAGDDGYTDILHSKRCESLLIQTILLKALYFVCENRKRDDFISDFTLSYRARPFIKSHRLQIEEDILPEFYSSAESFKLYYKSRIQIRNPFDVYFAKKFELTVLQLVDFINSKDTETKLKFLTFCELNYAHGF